MIGMLTRNQFSWTNVWTKYCLMKWKFTMFPDSASKWNITAEAAAMATTMIVANYSSTCVILFSIWILWISSITGWTHDNKDIYTNSLNAFPLKVSFRLLKQWHQYGLLHFILHHLCRGNCDKPNPRLYFFVIWLTDYVILKCTQYTKLCYCWLATREARPTVTFQKYKIVFDVCGL